MLICHKLVVSNEAAVLQACHNIMSDQGFHNRVKYPILR